MFSFLVYLVLPASFSFAGEVCPPSSIEVGSLKEISGHLTEQKMSDKTKAMQERLARLNSPTCRQKIWPDSKLLDSPARVIDHDTKAVFQFNTKTNRFDFLRDANPEDLAAPSFQFQNPGDGGVTLSLRSPQQRPPPPGNDPSAPKPPAPAMLCMNQKKEFDAFLKRNMPKRLQDADDGNMTLLAHESFHNADQNPNNPVHQHTGACKWAHLDAERSFAGDKEAIKSIRQHIMLNLKKALEAEPGSEARTSALAQVKAWSNKLKSDFPEANKKLLGIDRVEGSAEYVGMMSNIYGKLGCEASASAVRKEVAKYMNDRYMPIPQEVDQQAYFLGATAGLLLDEGGKTPDWKKQVTADRRSPLDLLLAEKSMQNLPTVAPTPDPSLTTSANLSKGVSSCMQGEAEKSVNEVLTKPGDYVLVEVEKVPFGMSGSYSVKTPSGDVAVYTEASAKANLVFEKANLISASGLCGESSGKYVAIPRDMIGGDGKISGSQEGFTKFSGTVPPPSSSKESWNGVSVVCQPK